jgi:hypothetical protein
MPIFLAKAACWLLDVQESVLQKPFCTIVHVLSRTGATRPQQRFKIMVAIEMPREFVSHPVMTQVSGIVIISLFVEFNHQIVKQLANFDYFLLLSFQLCSIYLLRL